MAKKSAPAPSPAAAALREPTLGRLRVDEIQPWDQNPRDHDAEQIRLIQKSLNHYGIVALPIVQAGTNKLIAGHGRVAALKAAGRSSEVIPVLVVELSDEDAIGYAIVDNRLTDLSTWNLPALKEALVELDNGAYDVELTGFTADALADLFPPEPPDDMGLKPGADPDAAPPCPEIPFLQPGDLVLMGRHRLLVGDATRPDDMDLLMCGCKADLLITDPPYNVDYAAPQWVNGMKGKAGKHPKSIKNDNMSPEAFQAFLDAAFERMAENTAPNAAFYVFHSAMAVVHFYGAMLRAGLDVRTQIIWNKAQAGYGFGHYRWKHEPIALAAKAGETPLIYLEAHETVFYALHHGQTPFWQGDKAQTTVWDCGRELANRIHPTQKPVDLLRKPISNSSRPNMLVLDPFGGSGSTLITCESMGRRCCTMEIDPKYAQVVLLRWQEATGKRASVMRHGNPVEVPRD